MLKSVLCFQRFLQLFKPDSNWVPAYKVKELKAAEKARKEIYRAKSSEENETQNGGRNVITDDVTQTTVADDDRVEKEEERKMEDEGGEWHKENGVLKNGDTHHVEMNGRESGDGGEAEEERRSQEERRTDEVGQRSEDGDVHSIDSQRNRDEENSVTFRNAAYDRGNSS